MVIKQKSLSLPGNLALGTFGEFLVVFSTKVNLLHLVYLLWNSPEALSSASDKAKFYLLKTFLRMLILMTQVPLYLFSFLELIWNCIILVIPKFIKNFTTNLDLSKASDPDCVPVVVLTNCESELSYILAILFNMCLTESNFPDCWKVSSVVSVFKSIRERSTAKNYCSISLVSAVCKVFEKLVNNRLVAHLEKYGLFSDFYAGFKSSWLMADLLTVASDRIA